MKIYEFIDSNKEKMVETLSKWIRIKSIAVENSGITIPYGDGCKEMMQTVLQDAFDMGFTQCKNFDNHMLTIDLKTQKPCLGVACHLDVVGANEVEWDTNPWVPTIKDNLLFGRGASDNKSAGVAALFALAALKNVGFEGNVRLYMGSAEEIGSPCFNYYQNKYERRSDLPPMIVPDAGNSITYGEWGILRASVSANILQDNLSKLVSIYCGEAYNIIPATAVAKLKNINEQELLKLQDKFNFSFEKSGIYTTIIAEGISCHSSNPKNGDNAALNLLEILTSLSLPYSEHNVLTCIKDMYKKGPKYIEDCVHDETLTFTLTGIFLNDGKITTWHDSRFSYDVSADKIKEQMQAFLLLNNCSVDFSKVKEPHFVEANSDFVSKLSDIYEEFEGEKPLLREMRAATYASQTINGVAYGHFSGGNIHSKNEYIDIDNIVKTAKLLAYTMLKFHEQNDMHQG